MKIKLITLIGGLLVFLISFFVYFLTASPYVQPGDSTEMATASVTLGIPHQPGYPLNTYLGHIAYNLNVFGSNGVFRVNLLSGFLQALTAMFFYFLVVELCGHIDRDRDRDIYNIGGLARIVAGFSSALFMAFSLIYWQYATKFEVFPLNNLFAVGIIMLC
jgi:hypothetical protein